MTRQGSVLAPLLLLASLVLCGVSCKDPAEKSAQLAAEHVAPLGQKVDTSVTQVEKGLPEGAAKLAALYPKGADPKADPNALKLALRKVRHAVDALNESRTTLFALTDENGVGIRSDFDTDTIEKTEFFKLFPALAGAKTSGYVATAGQFDDPDSAGNRSWIAASPVKREDGTVLGMLVAATNYRILAKQLWESLKNELVETAKANNARAPIFHVALFDASGVYGPKVTPPAVERAMRAEDLVTKTASGAYHALTFVEDRKYGIAAVRTKMGPDTGVLVLRAEL